MIARILMALGAWLACSAPAAASCIGCTCSVSATALSFGAVDPLATSAVDATGAVTVSCGPLGLLVGYDVRLSKGASGSYAARTLTSGSHTLSYNLFLDAARTVIWGDGSGGSAVVSNSYLITLGATTRSHTVYGRIPSLSGAAPGGYTDTITATIVY